MKQIIFLEMLRKLKSNPGLMRKVKIFAIVGAIGFVVIATLVVWAGISAFNYVAGKTNEVIQSPYAASQVENLKTEVYGLSNLQPLPCWDKAQTLIAVEPWLARPAMDNIKSLQVACFKAAPVCEGDECAQKEEG